MLLRSFFQRGREILSLHMMKTNEWQREEAVVDRLLRPLNQMYVVFLFISKFVQFGLTTIILKYLFKYKKKKQFSTYSVQGLSPSELF